MSRRPARLVLAALCALCLTGAMAGAVAAASALGGTPRHRHLARRSCQRHRRSGKHRRCPASPRRRPPGGARRSPGAPSTSASGGAGGTSISGAPSTSGSGGGDVGGAATPPGEAPLVQEPGTSGGAPSGPAHLQVSAKEFSLTLSHPTSAAGRLELELVNAGQDEHNLHIRPAGGGPDVGAVGIVLPGRHSDVEFQLKPGTYTLYCAIPAHEELGMKATLTVQ